MSIYAALDGEIAEQVATNKGWGDFCRWVESIEADGLGQLTTDGLAEDLGGLAAELESALADNEPGADVASVGKTLLEIIQGRGDAEVLTITDGLAPAEDDDE